MVYRCSEEYGESKAQLGIGVVHQCSRPRKTHQGDLEAQGVADPGGSAGGRSPLARARVSFSGNKP